MTACRTVSTQPSVKPTPPRVSCKQQAAPDVKPAPRKSEWVEWLPPRPGEQQGTARLSEKAALWIADTLGVVDTLRGLRKVEHGCLDEAEKKGLIQQ
jgi:hypothetical protein